MKMRKNEITIDKGLFIQTHLKEILKAIEPWMSNKHYDIRNLLKCNSEYLIAFGEKSNGKSTAMQMLGIICYCLFDVQCVLLRLYDEDFKKGRAEKMFGGIPKDFIEKQTHGKYDTIIYKHFAWHLAKYDIEKDLYIIDEQPFCFRQCILNAGSSFQMPKVQLILFDEFIRKDTQRNVSDEFVEYCTVVSTIKRDKTSLQILMMGNTVNYYSIYFVEMGLKNIRNQKQGTIDTYNYGDSTLSVSVEYCDTQMGKNSESNKYFAFNNPKLKMISNGAWQLDIYPHLPIKYKPKDFILSYYIKFDSKMFQCDIVNKDMNQFTFIHDEITKTPDFNCDIIYMIEEDARPNITKNISRCQYDWQQTIWQFYPTHKVFYKTNEIGDEIHAYLKWCLG